MSELRIEAALLGNLEEFDRSLRAAVAQAGRDTMVEVRDKGIGRLRSSLENAGLGAIDKTWRGEVYPERGIALNPALFIYSKAPEIIQSNQGEVIKAASGRMLAIPIPGSPAEDFPTREGTRVEYARKKFGDRLFAIPARPGRAAILAVDGVGITKTGKLTARKQTAKGAYSKGTMTVMLFWMVPQITMEARLDTDADFEWIRKMFEREYPEILGRNLIRQGLAN